MNNTEKFFTLKRSAKWYNPFFVEIKNKAYTLDKICIFDADGVRCSTSSGWFGNNNAYYPELRIDGCECIRKNTIDFTSEAAFITAGEPLAGEKRFSLYIPATVAGCEPPTATRGFNNRFFYIRWKLANIGNGETVQQWHAIDAGLSALEMVAEDEAKKIGYQATPNTLKEVAATLKRIEKKLRAEWERVNAKEAADVLKNYR